MILLSRIWLGASCAARRAEATRPAAMEPPPMDSMEWSIVPPHVNQEASGRFARAQPCTLWVAVCTPHEAAARARLCRGPA